MELYNRLQKELAALADSHDLRCEQIQLVARTMTAEEAIGTPEKKDFPLLGGREVMLEASFLGGRGEAYTSMPGHYTGSLDDLLALPLQNDFERACLVAGTNAVMRQLGLVERTVHCRDQDPERCAKKLVQYVSERFGTPRICFIGFQPAMIAALARSFPIRVVDLDERNIGQKKYDVLIRGPEETEACIDWAQIILATGSTSVNATMGTFLGEKPVVFYGVTVAALAQTHGYERFCPCAY
ncbi:MAG: hypothetical protein EOM37_14725 [Proteobacteria bacterium]|nr:hypothetical protein [Pseudomonadota bacterium]